jgi:hypothetical protein
VRRIEYSEISSQKIAVAAEESRHCARTRGRSKKSPTDFFRKIEEIRGEIYF